jgi:hypothetical protein
LLPRSFLFATDHQFRHFSIDQAKVQIFMKMVESFLQYF